eukprot:COSAG01_NODE_1165_length_11446_cov_16.276196_12_plen_40_part_00
MGRCETGTTSHEKQGATTAGRGRLRAYSMIYSSGNLLQY